MKISISIAILVALSSASWSDAADRDAKNRSKPNVIVFLADDLGYADFSRSKHSRDDVKTPHLDALMAAGTSFSNAYATSPICNPSRAGLISGAQQQRWGTYWYGSPGLPASEPTIPRTFRSMGYITKKIGKTHMGRSPVRHPLDHGFDEFLGFEASTWDYTRLSRLDVEAYQKRNGGRKIGMLHVGPLQRNRGEQVDCGTSYTSDIFGDEAVELVNRDRNGKPFYLQLEFNAVHLPTYVTDEKYSGMVGLEHEPWDRDAAEWNFPYWDPNKQSWGSWHDAWGNLEQVDPNGRKRYLSHLVGMDENIGRILAAVERSGQTEDTIVVFLSDNGGTINTYSCNAPLRGYKYMFGEGGIRVPMTISWPGHLPGNQTHDALVSAMDVFPTIMELAGGQTPPRRDGRSLVGLINGEQSTPHEFLCFTNGRGSWAIRKGDWKLSSGSGWEHANFKYDADGLCIRDEDPFQYPSGVHLFHLKDDIGETTSLSDQHPEIVAKLTKLYKDWRSQMSFTKSEGGVRRD